MMENIQKVDLTRIKPYGDTLNDGMVQMSFTLPVPYGDEANEAAKQLVEKMGFDDPAVVFSKDLGVGYTYFVIYGKCTIDYFLGNSLFTIIHELIYQFSNDLILIYRIFRHCSLRYVTFSWHFASLLNNSFNSQVLDN
jgi:hypothetical protein